VETEKSNEEKIPREVEQTSAVKTSEISLNNGQKWKVNEEMLPHIEKSEAVFKAFEGDNYQQLSEDMMLHTNNLIQSCTMDGASHDELHKWLHPHLELLKSLGTVSSNEAEKEIVPALEKSFKTFHKYFH
jgi:hypothetical protein